MFFFLAANDEWRPRIIRQLSKIEIDATGGSQCKEVAP